MDRCRQQNCRNQNTAKRNCYQQTMNYGSNYSVNHSSNTGCNQYMYDKMSKEDCPGMGKDELSGMPLAMSYVPWQRFCNLYEECEAVYHGTIFHDLDLDFCGKRCEQV